MNFSLFGGEKPQSIRQYSSKDDEILPTQNTKKYETDWGSRGCLPAMEKDW